MLIWYWNLHLVTDIRNILKGLELQYAHTKVGFKKNIHKDKYFVSFKNIYIHLVIQNGSYNVNVPSLQNLFGSFKT